MQQGKVSAAFFIFLKTKKETPGKSVSLVP